MRVTTRLLVDYAVFGLLPARMSPRDALGWASKDAFSGRSARFSTLRVMRRRGSELRGWALAELPVSSKGTIEQSVDNQIEQVGVDFVTISAKLVGDAHHVLDDVGDLVQGESNRPLCRCHVTERPTLRSAG